MSTYTKTWTPADGDTVDPVAYNAEVDGIISTINALDDANIASGAAINPEKLAVPLAKQSGGGATLLDLSDFKLSDLTSSVFWSGWKSHGADETETLSHGLGVAPSLILVAVREAAGGPYILSTPAESGANDVGVQVESVNTSQFDLRTGKNGLGLKLDGTGTIAVIATGDVGILALALDAS